MLSMVLSCFWYGHMLGGWAIVGALIVFFTLFDKSRRALPTRMVIRFARFPECLLAACPRMLVYFRTVVAAGGSCASGKVAQVLACVLA